jgi:hypothetical protein
MMPSKLSFYKVLKVSLFCLVVTTAGLLSLSSCQSKQPPSFIIVAVDRLSFNSFACSDEKSSASSGLTLLCKEALRFTHAYTTSTQSAAALGSILSGSYPYTHQLHRSLDRIHSKQKLLSELADQKNYRTSFLSGSPTILKKTGLSRGFDVFDDLSFLERKNYLSDFKIQSQTTLNWIKESSDPFFAILYNSELESLNEGQSEVSTFEKLDEKLSNFFSELKAQNQWENNFVIVVGLQGESDYSRPEDTMSSNLHSENTNVTLFIKPPRQMGDEGIHWKVDNPVNLADLGYSLMKTIEPTALITLDEHFSVLDFSYLWKKNETEPKNLENRKLLIEAINPWCSALETRFAIVYKNFIYIESKIDELYNTLNDGLETINITRVATVIQNDFINENRIKLAALRALNFQSKWTEYKSENENLITTNREYWSKPNSRNALLESEFAHFKKTKISQPLTALMLQSFVTSNKLDQLKILGLKIDNKILNYEKEKENYYDEARRQSINLSIENAWAIWENNQNWVQSTFIKEYQ